MSRAKLLTFFTLALLVIRVLNIIIFPYYICFIPFLFEVLIEVVGFIELIVYVSINSGMSFVESYRFLRLIYKLLDRGMAPEEVVKFLDAMFLEVNGEENNDKEGNQTGEAD